MSAQLAVTVILLPVYISTMMMYTEPAVPCHCMIRLIGLHMATSSFVGNERGNGSIIVFSDVSYNTVSFAQLWSYCSDRPQGNYPYITSSGTINSRTLNCFYYGASVRDGEKHSKPDDARCKIDGNNNQYGYSRASNPGCKWRNDDGSDRTPYFQFNGDRGWSRN